MAADKTREPTTRNDREIPSQPRTVLDPLRPGMVVRRRVIVDAPSASSTPLRTFVTPTNPPSYDFADGFVNEEDEDENGPPSSVNVARALASLRADELRRVEEIVEADDEISSAPMPALEVAQAPAAPPAPTLAIGKEVSLSDLAKKMNMVPQELATTLVARGFYSMTTKTSLSRETARDIAMSFGWRAEDAPEPAVDEVAQDSAPANSAVRSKKKKAAATAKKSRSKA